MASFAKSNLRIPSDCQWFDYQYWIIIYALFPSRRNDSFREQMCRLDHAELFTLSVEHLSDGMDIHWTLFIHLSRAIDYGSYHSTSLCSHRTSIGLLPVVLHWYRSITQLSTDLRCSSLYLWWPMLFVRTGAGLVWLDWQWYLHGNGDSNHQCYPYYTSHHPAVSNETSDCYGRWTSQMGR